jgi:hypothetical protein
MNVRIHQHARDRMVERGTTEDEIILTVSQGERFEAKHGRNGFRRNFPYNDQWRGRRFANKQVEAIAVLEDSEWLVITVLVKFF